MSHILLTLHIPSIVGRSMHQQCICTRCTLLRGDVHSTPTQWRMCKLFISTCCLCTQYRDKLRWLEKLKYHPQKIETWPPIFLEVLWKMHMHCRTVSVFAAGSLFLLPSLSSLLPISPSPVLQVPLRYLIGTMYVNFNLLWEPVCRLIM